MNPIVRNILAVIAGIIGGSIVNMAIILVCGLIFGIPAGMDMWDAESVKAYANQLTTANYVGVLIAHQLGTIVGALLAAKIAATRKMTFAIVIGVYFLFGGIYATTLIPAPIWFMVADLVLYIPSALVGGKIGSGGNAAPATEAPAV